MDVIPVEAVVAGALDRLARRPASALASTLEGTPVAAWETRMLPEGTDPLGGVAYVPRHAATFESNTLPGSATFLKSDPRFYQGHVLRGDEVI